MLKTQTIARAAGGFWLMTIVAGMLAMGGGSRGTAANLVATGCYLAATLLVYLLLRPVNGFLSLLAALFSVGGCVLSIVISLRLVPIPINPLVAFGLHCLLVGYLITQSTFLPKILGVLLAFGGLGWLTFAYPPFANTLLPWIILPGVVGEGCLSLWLVAFGVKVRS